MTDCVLDSRVQGRITKEYDAEGPTGLETVKWLLCDSLGTLLAEVGEPKPVRDANDDVILDSQGKLVRYDVANGSYFDESEQTTVYYHVDHTLTVAPALDVYGNELPSAYQRPEPTGTPEADKHRFVGNIGHTTEPDTGGLIYMRARWMDPVTGRFISEDPEGDGDNWYAYCSNNPVNLVDPTGESAAVLVVAPVLVIGIAALLVTAIVLVYMREYIAAAVGDLITSYRTYQEDYWHNKLRKEASRKAKDALREWEEGGRQGPRPRPKYPQRPKPGRDMPPDGGKAPD